MLPVLMGSFALVIAVGALAVAVSTTFALRDIESRMDSLSLLTAQIGEKVEKTTSATLRVEVDALAGGLDALSKRNRQEFGKLWARVRPFEDLPVQPPPSNGSGAGSDPEFQAMLALQSAGTPKQ